jgi:uracil-DNA glycosylase
VPPIAATINPAPPPRRERPPAAAGDTAAIPRFALSVVTSDRGILIVDEAPPAAARADYLRLLGNLLLALRRGGAQLGLDVFLWPMVKHSHLDQSAAAARATCAAYLHRHLQARAVDTVLLLGDTAANWVPEAERGQWQVNCVTSVSAWNCLREPADKRQLWQDLRALAAPPA